MPPGAERDWRESAAVYLARDEELLRLGQPSVRAAVVGDQTFSLGVAQPQDSPAATRARAAGIPVLRRSTGGTGVLHLPGDLVWSLVLPRESPLVGRDYAAGYARLGAGAVRFLKELGLKAEWAPAFGLSRELCVFGPRGRVLVVGGRAIGGAAQHVTARALLHHGMVQRTVDRPLISRIFGVEGSDLERHLTCLDELAVSAHPDELAERLDSALRVETEVAGR